MMDKQPALTIFIIEDAEFYSTLIVNYLKSKGYGSIYSFLTGQECLLKLEEMRPDIVIMDYELPGMNGLDAMRAIKARHPLCEVIFLSGQTDLKVALRILREGAYDYIMKDTHAKENLLFKVEKIANLVKEAKEKRVLRIGTWIVFGVLFLTWLILYLIPKFL